MEPQPSPPPQSTTPTFVWVAVLMGVVILALQALLLFLILDTRSGVTGLSEDLRDVELQLAGGVVREPDGPVAAPSTSIVPATEAPATTTGTGAPGTTLASALDDLPSSPPPTFEEGNGLPILPSNSADDPAVGAQLGSLAAVEWEQGDEVEIDLGDGTARAIVVFAHWCEPCQQLLPQLAEWQDSIGTTFENMELVTIATSTVADEADEADGTLPEYLSEQNFPFPVFVDEGVDLASALGVSSLPFWVFVSPDGRVIGRVGGQLPPPQFQTLFEDLEEIGAGS